MRNSFRKLKQDGKNILEAETTLNGPGKATSEADGTKEKNENDGVGDMQELGEFGLGVAPRDSRPVNKIELTKEKEAEIAEAQAYEDYNVSEVQETTEDDSGVVDVPGQKSKLKRRKAIDKQSAFLEFKADTEGKALEDSIRDDRMELRRIKGIVKEMTEKCNASKKSIDAVKG